MNHSLEIQSIHEARSKPAKTTPQLAGGLRRENLRIGNKNNEQMGYEALPGDSFLSQGRERVVCQNNASISRRSMGFKLAGWG